jgi:hypothetical protein
MQRLIAGIAAAFFACVGLCADVPTRDDLVEGLAKLIPPETVTDEQLVRAGIFDVKTLKYRELSKDLRPTDAEHTLARVAVRDVPQLEIGIDRGRGTIGVELVDARTQASLLSVGKRDSELRLNWLRYTVMDDAGNARLEVTDYEMDGQADVRMHYGSASYAEIWYADRWLRVERNGNAHGVYVNGQFKKVQSESGRLRVQTP